MKVSKYFEVISLCQGRCAHLNLVHTLPRRLKIIQVRRKMASSSATPPKSTSMMVWPEPTWSYQEATPACRTELTPWLDLEFENGLHCHFPLLFLLILPQNFFIFSIWRAFTARTTEYQSTWIEPPHMSLSRNWIEIGARGFTDGIVSITPGASPIFQSSIKCKISAH